MPETTERAGRETFLRDALTTVIEAGHTYGIGYWAHVRNVKQAPAPDYRVLSFEVADSDDGRTEPEAIPEADWKLVDPAALKRAFKLCEYPVEGLNDKTRGELVGAFHTNDAAGIIDGPMADIVVQIAALGKVVYG